MLPDAKLTRFCHRCNHDEDNHSLVATSSDNDPLRGGVILCPVKGCDCYATWSVPPETGGYGKEALVVPDRFRLEQLKEFIQG